MILEAKIDKQIDKETEWILESIFDEFCSMLELILDQFCTKKRLKKVDEIWWKNSTNPPGDPTPEIYTTGAEYKSGGTPGGGLGRGKKNNM